MTHKEMNDATPTEILKEYMEQKKMYHFEGEYGLERLNNLTKALGYKSSGFKYGSSLETFLADNPGACNQIVEFIEEYISEEQAESLSDELELEDDEDDVKEKVN